MLTSERSDRFTVLRDAYGRLQPIASPPCLLIACTDAEMDHVVEYFRGLGSTITLRCHGGQLLATAKDHSQELSAIDDAVERIGVREIVLFGHSLCPCVASRARTPAGLCGMQRLHQGVRRREAGTELARRRLVQQLERLSHHPSVRRALDAEVLQLHGCFYLAESGAYQLYDPVARRFVSAYERAKW